MAQINAYLKFDGNRCEAIICYKECFDGELIFNTVKGSKRNLKKAKKSCIPL